MEAPQVRFIPTDRTYEKATGRSIWSGNKPALCFRGEKKTHCVVIREDQIGTVDLPADVVDKCSLVPCPEGQGSGVPYPPTRFVKKVLETGKPLSPEARQLLQRVNGTKAKLPANKIKIVATPVGPPKPGMLRTAGAELIITIATEWKLPTPKLRRYLRSQGLHAPYQDEAAIRKALTKLKKGK